MPSPGKPAQLADTGKSPADGMRWYRVGDAVTNNRQTAAAWASDRLGPGKVEVLALVDGPVLESWAWLGKRNGRAIETPRLPAETHSW